MLSFVACLVSSMGTPQFPPRQQASLFHLPSHLFSSGFPSVRCPIAPGIHPLPSISGPWEHRSFLNYLIFLNHPPYLVHLLQSAPPKTIKYPLSPSSFNTISPFTSSLSLSLTKQQSPPPSAPLLHSSRAVFFSDIVEQSNHHSPSIATHH